MTKILIITSAFAKNKDDPGDFIFDHAKSLNQGEMQIEVLTPHIDASKFWEEIGDIKVFRFPYFLPLKMQRLAYGNGIPYNIRNSNLAIIQVPLFIASELAHTIIIIFNRKIEIINSHWLLPQGLVGGICKKVLQIPHIATLHSSEVTMLRKIPFGRVFSQFIAMNSDRIISVSKHRADEFVSLLAPRYREKCKQKIVIIPMGIKHSTSKILIDTIKLRSQLNLNSRHIVLFVGRLDEVKGCEYLIESFRTVIAHKTDALLIIIGGGSLEETLKKSVSEYGLDNCVRFEGFVEHDKIWDYYALADIVVIPSIVDSSGYEEGLPVVLLEAITAGKAVIGTNVKGICEVIQDGENGLLVNQKNSKQLADKILDLLKNDELRNTLSQNALSCADNYNQDFIADKYTDIIHELISLKKRERGGIE
ncbi:MAG: hypothetical protein CVV30_04440 [Methanomicrobiales archaeon HGW-Methanomicrobiales-1]|jgi:glycosyltransferase involved in cell wall biosynthesis|nr:MAG: hypothetical protein CVV30_04440 [Methanomicrobiales archaeon HGW-Methanomicrobiales-1]